MLHYTAIVTCLAVAFCFFTSTQVARARGRLGVKLPAITGNPEFERIFRVQMNTLEWMPIFLPSLWLFAIYFGDPLRPRSAWSGSSAALSTSRVIRKRSRSAVRVLLSRRSSASCCGSVRSGRPHGA